MKTDIHPAYYPKAKIKCACGHVFTIGSTKEKIEIEICSSCHPFYTGKEKLIDTAGKVEKFKARTAKAKAAPKKLTKTEKKKARAKKQQKSTSAKKEVVKKKETIKKAPTTKKVAKKKPVAKKRTAAKKTSKKKK